MRDSLLTVDALLNPERVLEALARLRAPECDATPDLWILLGR